MKFYTDRMDQIQKITPYVIYIIDVRDIQTLPGVFNFSLLDRLMDAAAGRGMGPHAALRPHRHGRPVHLGQIRAAT